MGVHSLACRGWGGSFIFSEANSPPLFHFQGTTFLSLLLKGQNLISAPPHHNQPKGKKDAKKACEYRDGIDEKDKSKIHTNFES